jgi:hypothetical protein
LTSPIGLQADRITEGDHHRRGEKKFSHAFLLSFNARKRVAFPIKNGSSTGTVPTARRFPRVKPEHRRPAMVDGYRDGILRAYAQHDARRQIRKDRP